MTKSQGLVEKSSFLLQNVVNWYSLFIEVSYLTQYMRQEELAALFCLTEKAQCCSGVEYDL